jgi:hypothetical protein
MKEDMSEISTIEELDSSTYVASLQEDDGWVEVRVNLSSDVMERLGTTAGDERRVVQHTLAFLLDRQHADELPDTLDLDDVIAVYDDFLEDMRRRLATSSG